MSNETIEMKCPICRETVTKVFDVGDVSRENAKCENEFYIHWRNMLYRIKEPLTLWSKNGALDKG